VSHLDNQYVLTGGYDQALRIWDTSNGKCLAQFIGHQSIITWCQFSSLDAWIASGNLMLFSSWGLSHDFYIDLSSNSII
jgi:WD40 repeat protein